jgi:4-amino-4-deoxy-L-arabinose transferase-like glycosyltransferase
LYLTAIFGKIFNLVGLVILDIDGMLYSGRAVSAVAGILSVYLVFLLGRRLISSPTGLLAAALLTFMPLHVTCSRYMKEDSLFTMFVWLAVAMLKELTKRVG